jgi:hypothetical protein
MQTPEAPPPLAGAPTAANIVLPEWLTYLMWGAVAFAALWLVSTIFIHMRRRATNLTSAQQAGVNKNAAPDFMKVDHKARDEAMKRGEAYDQELVEREKAAAAAAAGEKLKKEPVGILKMISGIAAFLFSLFTLVGAIVSTFRTLDSAGVQLSKMDQVGAVVAQYPIPSIICIFVIGYTIYIWVSQKRWTQPAKI